MVDPTFLAAVREMRRCQKRYFATRTHDALQASKAIERRVDELLDQADAGERARAQPSLFDGGDRGR